MGNSANKTPSSQSKNPLERNEAVFGHGNYGLTRIEEWTKCKNAVCMIRCDKLLPTLGSGFYAKLKIFDVEYHCIVTSNHVISCEEDASKAEATFNYEREGQGESIELRPDIFFHTSVDLDYTVIGVNERTMNRLIPGVIPFEYRELVPEPAINDEVSIFQHPEGGPKQFSSDKIKLIQRPFVRYTADTSSGSSGSPVLWKLKLLAIHNVGNKNEGYNKGTLFSEIIKDLQTRVDINNFNVAGANSQRDIDCLDRNSPREMEDRWTSDPGHFTANQDKRPEQETKRQEEIKNIDPAIVALQKALEIKLRLHGENHLDIAQIYHDIGNIQYDSDDYKLALKSYQHALEIGLKLFGEDHPAIAKSYHNIGDTQYQMEDYKSALESNQKALQIRLKLFGEDHPETAESYHNIGIVQDGMRDHKSALDSEQKALQIRLKLYGEDHSDAADSYHSIAITQHQMEDYKSALKSRQKALKIRLKLYGEDHADTADSYNTIGLTQHVLGDYKSALESHQHALQIRLKLFGKNHPDTAESYDNIGDTLDEMEDSDNSALESKQKALHIRLELYGKDHPDTAQSYRNIGIKQYQMEDYKSALKSEQNALKIRLKLHGRDHPETAECYHNIGATQHAMEDYKSALDSHQQALEIRLKLHMDDHPHTASSYRNIAATQRAMKDHESA